MRFFRLSAPLLCLLACLCLSGPTQAQTSPATADSIRRTERLLGRAVTRPQKAVVLALLLPGAGQVYNHQWWKLPLVYGSLGGLGYGLSRTQKLYREYVTASREVDNGTPVQALSGHNARREPTKQAVTTGLNRYRTRRDAFIGYTGIAYGVIVLDALVAAHLRDFDVSETLTMQFRPTLLPTAMAYAPGLQLRMGLASRGQFKTSL